MSQQWQCSIITLLMVFNLNRTRTTIDYVARNARSAHCRSINFWMKKSMIQLMYKLTQCFLNSTQQIKSKTFPDYPTS